MMEDDPRPTFRSRFAPVLVLCLVLAGAVLPLLGAPVAAATGQLTSPATATSTDGQSAADGGITDVDYSGSGIVPVERNRTYVWQDGNTTLDVVVQPLGDPGQHELCLTLRAGNETARDYGCRTLEVQSYGKPASFELRGLGNATGNHTFHLRLRRADDPTREDTARVNISVITREGDVDGDSLSNEAELEHNTSLVDADTDTDGLLDGPEVMQYNSSATAADTDGDGARDAIEIQAGSDPGDPDTDDDGLTDGEELNQYGTDPTEADTDGDGLDDYAEVKRYGTDPTQVDTDSDGLDDYAEVKRYGTDPTVADTDDDGLNDGEEIERGTDPLEATYLGGESVGGDGPLNRNVVLFVGFGLVLTIGGFAAYLHLGDDSEDVGGTSGGSPPPDAGASGPEPATTHEPDGDTPMEPPDDEAGTAAPDPDLLSPEQYVEHLLEANDGYMKQSDIVDEVDWSKATVSRRLSSMEEAGAIERTRMGRGKIVTLPEVELDETS